MTAKKSPFYLIGGILFAFMALRQIYYMIRGGFGLWSLLYLLVYGLIAAGVLMGKKTPLPVAGFALMTLLELRNLFYQFRSRYCFVTSNYRTGRDGFNLLTVLPALLSLATVVLALLLAIALILNTGFQEQARRLWFLPAAANLAALLVGILLHLFFRLLFRFIFWNYGYSYASFGTILSTLLESAALLFSFMGMAQFNGDPVISMPHREAASYQPTYQTNQGGTTNMNEYMKPHEEKYYCGLVKHILLLVFTFGIWQLIWIYRMTEYLNGAEGEPRRTPTSQLLLCLFVPFYLIFWTYQSGQRIDKMAHARGVESDLTILCLILSIFVAIVPPILMQEKINTILTAPADAAPIPEKQPAAEAAPQRPVSAPARHTAPAAAPTLAMGRADEIKKYKELLDAGALTEEEFTMVKRQILGLPLPQSAQTPADADDLPEL